MSCSSEFLEEIRNAFVAEVFTVSVDEQGLSGGYIVSTYGFMAKYRVVTGLSRYENIGRTYTSHR